MSGWRLCGEDGFSPPERTSSRDEDVRVGEMECIQYAPKVILVKKYLPEREVLQRGYVTQIWRDCSAGSYRGTLGCEHGEQGSAGINDAAIIDLKNVVRCHRHSEEIVPARLKKNVRTTTDGGCSVGNIGPFHLHFRSAVQMTMCLEMPP